jgi:hypothetical protein
MKYGQFLKLDHARCFAGPHGAAQTDGDSACFQNFFHSGSQLERPIGLKQGKIRNNWVRIIEETLGN